MHCTYPKKALFQKNRYANSVLAPRIDHCSHLKILLSKVLFQVFVSKQKFPETMHEELENAKRQIEAECKNFYKFCLFENKLF